MNTLYEQQIDNMQKMNQKWLDVFSKLGSSSKTKMKSVK
jgi:hypothetical protein